VENSPKPVGVPPDIIHAFSVPQPDKYNIMIKGHEFCLRRSEVVTLYRKLLDIIPYEKETICDTIKIVVSRAFGVSLRDINSTARPEKIVIARHAAIWLCLRAGVKRREISDSFMRNYDGVSYSVREFDKRLNTNPKLLAKMVRLEGQLKELIDV